MNSQKQNNQKFYKEKDFIFLKSLRKKARIKYIDKESGLIKATYFKDDGELTEGIFGFQEVNKYRPKKKDVVLFAKVDHNSDAIIPSKRYEDGCYDINSCFEQESIWCFPNTITKIPTGIASSFSPKYRFNCKRERGSTGKFALNVVSGQIDSGYRGEWFINLNNTGDKPIEITKKVKEVEVYDDHVKYPYTKAICQAALEEVPDVTVKEISYDELKQIPSERGTGIEGSSGK